MQLAFDRLPAAFRRAVIRPVAAARAARRALIRLKVYNRCMARTNIDIDDVACAVIMRRYGLSTKREAVNFALRELALTATVTEARQMRGAGWEGDLDELRQARVPSA